MWVCKLYVIIILFCYYNILNINISYEIDIETNWYNHIDLPNDDTYEWHNLNCNISEMNYIYSIKIADRKLLKAIIN